MAEQSKETLKSYFQTGDKPTEANFSDLIDTMAKSSDLTTALSDIDQAKKDIQSMDTLTEDLHSFILSCSAETGQIPTGDVFTFRMPYGFILIDVRASLNSPPASGSVQLTVSANDQLITNTIAMSSTTTGANTTALLGENGPAITIPRETEIKVNVSSAPYGATGLKVSFIGRRATGAVTLSLADINFDDDLGVPISFVDAEVI